MEFFIPSEFVYHVKGLITPELCKTIIDLYQKDTRKHPGSGLSNKGEVVINSHAKLSLDLEMADDGAWKDAHKELHKTISEIMAAIAQLLPPLQGRPLQWTGYKIQHYAKNQGHFNWHFDSAGPGTWERQMAMIIYLNTVKDGGETSFIFQKLKIKPEAGAGLFFPTFWTHTHCGEIPTSEDKYIISSFVSFKTAATENKKSA